MQHILVRAGMVRVSFRTKVAASHFCRHMWWPHGSSISDSVELICRSSSFMGCHIGGRHLDDQSGEGTRWRTPRPPGGDIYGHMPRCPWPTKGCVYEFFNTLQRHGHTSAPRTYVNLLNWGSGCRNALATCTTPWMYPWSGGVHVINFSTIEFCMLRVSLCEFPA